MYGEQTVWGPANTRAGGGMGEGACLKLEPAGCLPALCPYPPFHPSPQSLGVSQWSGSPGNALQGVERDGR